MKRTALLSVSDKTGLLEFARGLAELGFELISTGGTMQHLVDGGLAVTSVSEVGGFPEILDGRVKTLQPRIHGGILARRDDAAHMAQLAEHGIRPIDLVCVNLYPFEQTVAKANVRWDEAIENIDIGGPAMVRAAAKNHESVLVVVRPDDYGRVLAALRADAAAANGGADGDGTTGVTQQLRRELALTAFRHTAAYDAAISAWLGEQLGDPVDPDATAWPADRELPERLTLRLEKIQDLRYGENPHQRAAFYRTADAGRTPSVATAEQLWGKELSFNNINDADAALRLVLEFGLPAAVAVKHTNPCGTGIGPDLATAFDRAFRGDEVSIFGGIVAFNRCVDEATAKLLKPIFLEIVIAPDFEPEALDILKQKKDLRLLQTGYWPGTEEAVIAVPRPFAPPSAWDYKRVQGGLLVQEQDKAGLDRSEWRVVSETPVPDALWRQLELAWLVCKHVKSNAIVLAKDDMTIGVGAGQMNRIDAARHAIAHAAKVKGIEGGARGAVLASDAFFPFPDVVEAAGEAGIAAIVQPGGSIRDQASIDAANRLGISLVFTGQRHFRH